MSDDKSQVEELINSLKQQRDEISLQIHLAKADAKDEWDRWSGKLDNLLDEYQPVQDAVADSADNVWAALKLVAGEVQDGFHRVRKSL